MSEILRVGICRMTGISGPSLSQVYGACSTYLAVHEDARQVELDLETDVDVRSVDRRCEPDGSVPFTSLPT